MAKPDLYDRLNSATEGEGDTESLIKNLCDYFDSSVLVDFVEFVEKERGLLEEEDDEDDE